MIREQMIAGLREGFHFSGQERYDIAAQLQADGETIARLEADLDAGRKAAHDSFEQHRRQAAEIASLTKERDDAVAERKACHEIWANFRKVLSATFPGAPGWPLFQSAEVIVKTVNDITADRAAAISALAEEGRKRGTAEAIIADMLRLDRDGSEEEWRAVCDRARAVLALQPNATIHDPANLRAVVGKMERERERRTGLESARSALRPADGDAT